MAQTLCQDSLKGHASQNRWSAISYGEWLGHAWESSRQPGVDCCLRHILRLLLFRAAASRFLIGRGLMTEKIRLLVKMDIDGAQVRITAQGHLTPGAFTRSMLS